jgi:hypothetical protein
VKIHNRGTGGGSGPVDYLTGKDRDREGASVLRGDLEVTRALIDSSLYSKKYTSGVLSFEERDLPDDQKQKIMDSFQDMLLPGLDRDQYDCLWVEHQDKGRLELNFVIPNTELLSGKRLQPYYHPVDGARVDCWKRLVNDALNLHSPDDPANRRALCTPNDLPETTKEAQESITNGLLSLTESGVITTRDDVVRALTEGGFNVVRQNNKSISIENPEGGRNIRLKGALYEKDFQFGPELREEIERRSEQYRAQRKERIPELRAELTSRVEYKASELTKRHPRPKPDLTPDLGKQRKDHKQEGSQELEGRINSDFHQPANLRGDGVRARVDSKESSRGPLEAKRVGYDHNDMQHPAGPSPVRRSRPDNRLDSTRRQDIHNTQNKERESLNERIRQTTRQFCERAVSATRGALSKIKDLCSAINRELSGSSAAGRIAEQNNRDLDRACQELGKHAERARESLERDSKAIHDVNTAIEKIERVVLNKERSQDYRGPSMRM